VRFRAYSLKSPVAQIFPGIGKDADLFSLHLFRSRNFSRKLPGFTAQELRLEPIDISMKGARMIA